MNDENKIYFSGYNTRREMSIDDLTKQVGPGWKSIVENLINDLFLLGWNGEYVQIKEKFGGLRFYIQNGNTEIRQRIHQAEQESVRTCDVCGNDGTVETNEQGWYNARCSIHRNVKWWENNLEK